MKRVVAETSNDNLRMLRVFERRDFARLPGDDDTTVFLERSLVAAPAEPAAPAPAAAAPAP